jgi:hypothetical protein
LLRNLRWKIGRFPVRKAKKLPLPSVEKAKSSSVVSRKKFKSMTSEEKDKLLRILAERAGLIEPEE